MGQEFKIIHRREIPGEPALVVQLEDLNYLNHPEVDEILTAAGISRELFEKLLRKDFVVESEANFSVPNEQGEKKEDIHQLIARIQLGLIEVSDCRLYPAAESRNGVVGFHLKVEPKGGFEAILALEGRAVLAIPDRIEAVALGIYAASRERTLIEMKPGTLAILPAGVGNDWIKVDEGFEFLYICCPPWNSNFVRPAYSY